MQLVDYELIKVKDSFIIFWILNRCDGVVGKKNKDEQPFVEWM